MSFDVNKLPSLKNGHLKICHLNASLLFVLRAYPDIMTLIHDRRMTGRLQPFVSVIEEVLTSRRETDLLGLKGAMKERHPGERAYDEGWAQEVLHQLLEDLNNEFAEDDRFRHVRVVTEDKSTPLMCSKCRQPLAGFCDSKPSDLSYMNFRPLTSRAVTIQQLLDKYEETKRDCEAWTACLDCKVQQKVRAVSELKEAPDKFVLESVTGATNTIHGFEEDASWGSSTFQPCAVFHHSQREEHFFVSVREGDTWWRYLRGPQHLKEKICQEEGGA